MAAHALTLWQGGLRVNGVMASRQGMPLRDGEGAYV